MTKVAIVTDSTASIPVELIAKYPIRVAPLTVSWGNESYRDGIDITPQMFYERLQKSAALPTSSQPTPDIFKAIYLDLLDEGYDILSILISSGISGTVSSAMQAKEAIKSERIEVFDSQHACMPTGLQVLAAARAALEGATLKECLAVAEKARSKIGVYFIVDTLKYLHKGGRIGGASAFFGGLLDVKPLLTFRNGRITADERVRTRKKAIERMFSLIEKEIDGQTPVRLATMHAAEPEMIKQISEMAIQRFNPVEMINAEVSPVIGTHIGPGTLSLAYMTGL